MEFEKELEMLINKHSKENESDTPDFILAQYLKGCMTVYAETIKARDKWYGFKGLQSLEAEKLQLAKSLYLAASDFTSSNGAIPDWWKDCKEIVRLTNNHLQRRKE